MVTGQTRSRRFRDARALLVVLALSLSGTAIAAGAPAESLRLMALQSGVQPLATVAIPDPPGLAAFVRDRVALQQLGKALFWDMQAGSDGQACASCHFHAGADNRSKNQLNPGFRNQTPQFPGGDIAFGNSSVQPLRLPPFGPNYQLTLGDFPLHRKADPNDRSSLVLTDTNDVVSSQGVFAAVFRGLGSGPYRFDLGTPDLFHGSIFAVGGAMVRNVEPRNTPSAINAVLNRRNFWDGRARSEYNGVNPIGSLDPGAVVVRATAPGAPVLVAVSIGSSSAASQADGPALSALEMSFDGRRFAELGRKLLAPGLVPLGLQVVAPDDSVLGTLRRQGPAGRQTGLAVTYAQLVQRAFQVDWWNAPGWSVDAGASPPAIVPGGATGASVFTVAEFNFSLFFGLAIQEYERTLVSDDTPLDRFLAGDDGALGVLEQAGLAIFLGRGRCVSCHGGPALSNAAIGGPTRERGPIERMVMADGRVAVYDSGFYNIGVRLTREDVGIGATIGPANLPLSESRRHRQCVADRVAAGASLADANASCGVPPIRARPLEAILLLRRAAVAAGGPALATADIEVASVTLSAAFGNPGERGPVGPADALAAYGLLREAAELLRGDPGASPAVLSLVAAAVLLLPDPASDGGADPLDPQGPLLGPDERTAVDGALKVPSLRNVELTAPYFHNGGQATLEQVVQFYGRGGDFHDENIADLDPDIGAIGPAGGVAPAAPEVGASPLLVVTPLGLDAGEQATLVAFLKALTDERVRWERAPFDHPSLDIPNGGTPGRTSTLVFPGYGVLDDRVLLPAVGSGGGAAPLGTPHSPLANFPDPLR